MAILQSLDKKLIKIMPKQEDKRIYLESMKVFPGLRHSPAERMDSFLSYRKCLEEFVELDIGGAFNIDVSQYLNQTIYSMNIMKQVARKRLESRDLENEKVRKMLED